MSSVVDNGTWNIGSQNLQYWVYQNTIPCCTCPTGYSAGAGGYTCSPVNNGYGCYRIDYNYHGSNCRLDFSCCLCGCGCVAEDCGFDVYYSYYDSWSASWDTTYSIMKWQYGQWVQVGQYVINTGGTPVFV